MASNMVSLPARLVLLGVLLVGCEASGSDVARCIELATRFRDNCAAPATGDADRVCLWDGYIELCETGDTELLIASMECLDETRCAAFSDAGEGDACLASVHAALRAAALGEVIEDRCTACGGSECAATASGAEILPYLRATAASHLERCAASSCSLDQIVDACADDVAPLAAFECSAPAADAAP